MLCINAKKQKIVEVVQGFDLVFLTPNEAEILQSFIDLFYVPYVPMW